jgi:hypothetical protein
VQLSEPIASKPLLTEDAGRFSDAEVPACARWRQMNLDAFVNEAFRAAPSFVNKLDAFQKIKLRALS